MGQIWLEGYSLQTPDVKDKLSEARNFMWVAWGSTYFYFGMSHAHRRGSFNTIRLKAPLRHPIIPNHKWRERTSYLERTENYSGSQIFGEHYDLHTSPFKFSWSQVVPPVVCFHQQLPSSVRSLGRLLREWSLSSSMNDTLYLQLEASV